MNNIGCIFLSNLIMLVVFFYSLSPCQAEPSRPAFRILDVKAKVFSRDSEIKLKELINNPKMLTKAEQNLVVMSTPVEKNSVYSLVDIAYMLQKYKELHDVKLRGTHRILVQKMQNLEYLYKAKDAVKQYISSNDPWKDWEIDILFSNDDELRITKAGEFEKVHVFPYDNKSMIGAMAFRLVLLDEDDNEVNKVIINPVILKKTSVVVINSNTQSGHILKQSDMKLVPMWIGAQKKNYMTDMSKCLGKEVARKMTYGDIIKSSDILNPVCVKRGEIIWVTCISGALNVRVAAIALENGRQGDYIKVKNNSSNKEFMVELTGPKKAMYHLKG